MVHCARVELYWVHKSIANNHCTHNMHHSVIILTLFTCVLLYTNNRDFHQRERARIHSHRCESKPGACAYLRQCINGLLCAPLSHAHRSNNISPVCVSQGALRVWKQTNRLVCDMSKYGRADSERERDGCKYISQLHICWRGHLYAFTSQIGPSRRCVRCDIEVNCLSAVTQWHFSFAHTNCVLCVWGTHSVADHRRIIDSFKFPMQNKRNWSPLPGCPIFVVSKAGKSG